MAKRIGTIQTLSEAEQQRLAEEGILEVLENQHETGDLDGDLDDDDPEPAAEKEPVAP